MTGVTALMRAASNGTLNSATQIKPLLLAAADTNVAGLVGKVPNGARLNAFRAVQAAIQGLPPASPSPPPPPPSPPAPPPPPMTLNATPLQVGSLPFMSAQLDLAAGSTAPLDARLAAFCPSAQANAMLSTTLKNVWQLTGLPTTGSMNVDDCTQPSGVWDSISALLVCSPDMSSCSCYADDDGCGVASGDKVTGVPLTGSGSKVYYSIIMAYST